MYLPIAKSGTSKENVGCILSRDRVNTSDNLDFVATAY
jgi:hypothetical protein